VLYSFLLSLVKGGNRSK